MNFTPKSTGAPLLEIAGARRPGVAWEGSAWIGAADVLPRDRLRHALVTPRLIAPHPNAGTKNPIDADEAVALLVQARLSNLRQFAEEHPEVPHLHDVSENADWRWRFAAALRQRVVRDRNDDLIARVADAPTPADHAAATVAAATSLIEIGCIADALQLLDAAIEKDEAERVDHAWLLAQRARARAEVGRIAEAQDDALRAQGVRLATPGDATASAIAASAAILLFNTASWEDKDVGAMATSADTAASWWRTQIIDTGLWGITERSFSSWVDREPTTYADGVPGHNKLTAAALMASHAGEHGSWRHLTAGVAKSDLLELDRHADPRVLAAGLEQLRLAGDHRPLESAVGRVVANGPARAVTMAAASVDLEASTRTTVHADLALLDAGGDVLEVEFASHTVRTLMAAIAEPDRLEARTVPGYRLSWPVLEALGGVVVAADAAAQRAVAEYIIALPAVDDYALAASWARVVAALPHGAWVRGDAVGLRDAYRHHDRLRIALLGIAERLGDQAARDGLAEAVRACSSDALSAASDLASIPDDALTALIASVVQGMDRRRAEADGSVEMGYVGPRVLANLNCVRPDLAQWEPLLALLADDDVPGAYKLRALQPLIARVEQVPEDVKDRLTQIATALAEPGRAGDEAIVRDATALAIGLGAYDDETVADRLLELLRGDDVARVRALAAIEKLGIPETHVGIPVALTGDSDPYVRAWAAALLAQYVNRGGRHELAVAALRAAADDPGTIVPEAIANALNDPNTPTARNVLLALTDHRSATVRVVATRRVHSECD